MASLRHPIMVERSQYGSGMRAWLHLSPQLVHLCVEHQINGFMGCDYNIELLIKELKGATGLGQHQVTKEAQRVERSVAMSVMASLMIVKFHAQDIPGKGPWSLFSLNHHFTWQLVQGQPEIGLQFRPGLLDRGQIRRIGGK
jgi:hypothetical protein